MRKERRRLRKIAFISHSSGDKAIAEAACAVLEKAGVRCWIAPRDIRPGVEYGDDIIDAIERCSVMVLILSSRANQSCQVRREIERVVSKGIPVVPVRIDDAVPTKSMEYFLGAIHWLDARTPPLEGHLQKLAETVKTMLQLDKTKEKVAKLSPPYRPHSCAPSLPAVMAARAAHALWLPRLVRWGMVVLAVTDLEKLVERFIEFVSRTITLVT